LAFAADPFWSAARLGVRLSVPSVWLPVLIKLRTAGRYKPELVHDMPANGPRFIQRVEGYEATLVAGAPIFERGQHTGAMPGRLVRAGRDGEIVKAA
jgi:N-acyl-D-aspartate/D-glutamate deacylase